MGDISQEIHYNLFCFRGRDVITPQLVRVMQFNYHVITLEVKPV